MKSISVLLIALMALVPSATFWPAPADAQAGGTTVPVTGTVQQPGSSSGRNSFVGSFTITRFEQRNNQVVAVGTLVGKAGNTPIGITTIAMPLDTAASRGVNRAAAGAVGIAQIGECDILHLVLGPLHIDLLGLEIDLNQVVLDIVAQAGGGLLGDLLCAIANLLNPLGDLATLIGFLNDLLALLAGL
jgi:hypothetical protein